MDKIHLIQFCKSVFNVNIDILQQTESGKWYEQKYCKCDAINENSIYGVYIDGIIWYTFKTGKKESYLKTFANQHINKYEMQKNVLLPSGQIGKQKKEDIIMNLKANRQIFSKWLFYVTEYGIGFFCFFMGDKYFNQVVNQLGEYLNNSGISFNNEYSDAQWVYRFKIHGNRYDHVRILSEFTPAPIQP